MVDASETQENPVIESETQAVSEGEEIYEYEYVELEEGQELPEGYEYEYVEVDENGNPIETDETGISAEDGGQFLEAGQGKVSLDTLLNDEAAAAEMPIVPASVEETAELPAEPVNLDDLQLADIQIPEEIVEPDAGVSTAELVNNTNDESVFAEPEGIVFQNDDDEAADRAWLEENNPQPVAAGAVEVVTEAVVEAQTSDTTVEAEEVINDEELLSPEEGEMPLNELLDAEASEETVAVGEAAAEEVPAGAVPEPAEDILADAVSQEVDDELIETLGDVVVPSADEVSGGIPPIENSVMEEMIADGETVSTEEISDNVEVEAVVEEEKVQMPEPAANEEMLAGVLDAVAENIAEQANTQAVAETRVQEMPVEAEKDVVPVEAVVEESPVVPAADDVVEAESAVEEKIVPVAETVENAVSATVEEAAEAEMSVMEDTVVEETAVPEFSEEADFPAADAEREAEILIPQTNIDDNIFVDEELELPPELPETAVAAVAAGAEMLLVGNRDTAQLSVNSAEIQPKFEDAETKVLEELALTAYPVSKNDGIRTLTLDEGCGVLLLNELDFENNELRFWNMVLFDQHILPLKAPVSNVNLPLEHGVNRRITLIRNGIQKIKLFNEDNIKIINATNACAKVEGRFICGDLGDNSGLVIDDCLTVPLADMYGKVISFALPAAGFLSGPNGALIYFSELKQLVIPNNEKIKADAEKMQYRISKWYSGTANDKYFEFSANSESAVFEGNDEIKAIHVNVNNSSYGWNVAFDNGLSMNLRDLREYQTRFGRMPSPNGVISYGKKTLTFSKVERIVVYESVQYFFYS